MHHPVGTHMAGSSVPAASRASHGAPPEGQGQHPAGNPRALLVASCTGGSLWTSSTSS